MKHVPRLSWLFLLFLALPLHLKAQEISVELRVSKSITLTRSEPVPNARVDLGGRTVMTDERGRVTVTVAPGRHLARVSSPCPVNQVSVIGSVRRSGGTDEEPILDFPWPSNQSPSVTFLTRCDAGSPPAGPTRGSFSCFDGDPGMVSMNPSMHRSWASRQTKEVVYENNDFRRPVSMHNKALVDNLSRKVDLLGECSGVTHEDLSFLLAQMSYLPPPPPNHLPEPYPQGQEPRPWWDPNALRNNVEWAHGQSRNTVLNEIKQRIAYRIGKSHEHPDDAFVSVSMAIAGWFEHAVKRGSRSETRKSANSAYFVKASMTTSSAGGSLWVRGYPLFDNEPIVVDYEDDDGTGLDYVIIANLGDANIGPQGGYSPQHAWQIEPGNSTRKRYEGTTMFAAVPAGRYVAKYLGWSNSQYVLEYSIDFTVEKGTTTAPNPPPGTTPAPTPANRSLVRPTKPLFAPGEEISVDYFNANGSGWDWVVIVDPAKIRNATGPHGSIADAWAHRFDINDNSSKERSGMARFPALPEGSYEARYISWAGGNNTPIASEPFKVGKGSGSPMPPGGGGVAGGGAAGGGGGGGGMPPSANFGNLTGLWRQPGSTEVYRIRHIGNRLYWGIDGTARDSVANIYFGDIKGNTVDGIWIDLPGSPYVGDGKIFLRIESDCRMVKTAQVNHYAAEMWVKIGSQCDQVGGRQTPPPPVASYAKDLTGLWKNPGSDALYRVRQIGNRLYWGIDATPMRSFANTYYGDIAGDTVDGIWIDLPGSPYVGDGKIFLKIESECRMVKKAEVNHYAAEIWVKQGSLCDVTGQQQKAAQPPATTAATPKVAQIPDDAGSTQPAQNSPPVVVISDPAGVFDDKPTTAKTPPPKIAEKTDNRTAASKPPTIAQIPDDRVVTSPPPTKTDPPPVRETPARTTPARTQPTPKPTSTPAPKKEGPGFWERLGGAINQAVTQQQQQPAPGGTTRQPQRQPAGTCRGGAYWIGTPTPPGARTFQMPWSSPFGTDRHHFRVYRAGTGQIVTDNDQPQNTNACGMSWHFSLPPGQYDIYLFPGTFANTRSTSTRPVAGPIRVIVN